MDPAEHHRRTKELFDPVLQMPGDERSVFLTEQGGDDTELRAEVQSLLKHHLEASTGCMKPPERDRDAMSNGPYRAEADP